MWSIAAWAGACHAPAMQKPIFPAASNFRETSVLSNTQGDSQHIDTQVVVHPGLMAVSSNTPIHFLNRVFSNTMHHPHKLVSLLAGSFLALMTTGFGGTPTLRDARFAVVSVDITGPATIRNGSSETYTVTATINRDKVGLNELIVGTQGPPPPRIRPAIFAGNTQLVFDEVNVPAGTNTVTARLTLSCNNNEVRGAQAGSGHGGQGRFLFWSWQDPAEIKGHLNETESSPVRVLCN